jgi:hypothetical protein
MLHVEAATLSPLEPENLIRQSAAPRILVVA